ncbi:MAG: ATP synthase F1 subunit gamma [Tannerella sp.]|jgi:F-type H+-transporting ATPase subunit gamma|nr:ATP synthase F1 subunit gamma [Tannerella sp.]
MATLREIKGRIVSITSTRKITSAMKMVSSSKLHRAQGTLKDISLYAKSLHHIMQNLLQDGFTLPQDENRPVRHAAVIVFSSDNALCGAFNSNVVRELQRLLASYRDGKVEVTLYAVGRKVFEYARREGVHVGRNYEKLSGVSAYAPMAALAEELTGRFERKEIDRVEMIYHRFKSVGTQHLVCEPLLPLTLSPAGDDGASHVAEYILEPDRASLIAALIPQSLKLHVYTALLHSCASEHAVRMIAMQMATDNADELIDELTVAYNKSRQQAITSELLDIVGGAANGRM